MDYCTPSPKESLFGGTGRMRVQVLAEDDGSPVAGALISLKIASSPLGDNCWNHHEPVSVGRTDPKGTLDVDRLHPRRYLLDAEAPGFVRFAATVLLKPKTPLPVEGLDWRDLWMGRWNPAWEAALSALPEVQTLMPVVPEQGSVTLTLRLPRARTIEGIVRDPDGRPIPEARVSIAEHEFRQSHAFGMSWFNLPPNEPVFSNTAGRFVLSAHPSGQLTIRVDAAGFVYDQKQVDAATAAPPELDFVLAPCAAIRGRVLAPSGAPVEKATVAAFVPSLGGRIFHTKTDQEGRFRLDDLERKPLIVIACGIFEGASRATVVPGSEPIEFVLETPRRLEGRVVDLDGRPIPGAMVSQRLAIREGRHWISFGWHESNGPKGFVSSRLPGLLNVGIPIQEPYGITDAQGRFTFQPILTDAGTVYLQVFQSSPDNYHRTMEGKATLGRDEDIVFNPVTNALGPSAKLGGIYAEVIERPLETAAEYGQRAGFREAAGDKDGALADYAEALRLKPGDPDVLQQRAMTYLSCSRYADALANYTELLRLRPEDPELYYRRAYIHRRMSDEARAIADLSEAIRLAPGEGGNWRGRSQARLSAGDAAGALADAEEALRLQPEDPISFLIRAAVREKLGEFPAALEDCERALALRPDANGYHARARVRRGLGDLRGALTDLEAALGKIHPVHPDWRERVEKEIEQVRRDLGL